MQNGSGRARFWGIGLVVVAAIVAAGVYLLVPNVGPQPAANAATAPTAVPVSVAVVEPRNVALWDEFSGRLEAVERVDVRSRVAGAIDAVHFREGARVAKGDVLISLDPAP
jgi:multidrug efflux system membrane fusion protein